MRLITANDIIGQIAYSAVRQHPYNAPEGLFELIQDVLAKSRTDFTDGVPPLPMRWFKDSNELQHWLRTGFEGHKTLDAWNKPKSGHDAQIMFTSRYDTPPPDDDFIDIDALWMNVSREAWKSAEEFEKPDAALTHAE